MSIERKVFETISQIMEDSRSHKGYNRLSKIISYIINNEQKIAGTEKIVKLSFLHSGLKNEKRLHAAGLRGGIVQKRVFDKIINQWDRVENAIDGLNVDFGSMLETSFWGYSEKLEPFYQYARSLYYGANSNNIVGKVLPDTAKTLSNLLIHHTEKPNYLAFGWDPLDSSPNTEYYHNLNADDPLLKLLPEERLFGLEWVNHFETLLSDVEILDKLPASKLIADVVSDIDRMKTIEILKPIKTIGYLLLRLIQFQGAFGGKYYLGIPIHVTRRVEGKLTVSLLSIVSDEPLTKEEFDIWVIVGCIIFKDFLAEDIDSIELKDATIDAQSVMGDLFSFGHPLKRRTEPIKNAANGLICSAPKGIEKMTPEDAFQYAMKHVSIEKEKISVYANRLSRFGTIMHIISLINNPDFRDDLKGQKVFISRPTFRDGDNLRPKQIIDTLLDEMKFYECYNSDIEMVGPEREQEIKPWLAVGDKNFRPHTDIFGFLFFELIHNAFNHIVDLETDSGVKLNKDVKTEVKKRIFISFESEPSKFIIFIKNTIMGAATELFEKYKMEPNVWQDQYKFTDKCGGLWNAWTLCRLTQIGSVNYRFMVSEDGANEFEVRIKLNING